MPNDQQVAQLEALRRRSLEQLATVIQASWRRWALRRRYNLMRRTQIRIARAWRKYRVRGLLILGGSASNRSPSYLVPPGMILESVMARFDVSKFFMTMIPKILVNLL